jgi:hypothetical protein
MRRLGDHDSTEPNGVAAQLAARESVRISPSPAKSSVADPPDRCAIV